MHTNRLITSLRRGAALALACLLAPAGFGQTAPTPATSTAASSGVQKLETFEVTGSRIRLGVEEADFSPMITIGRLEIEQSGLTSMGEISRLIPQAFSTGSYEGVGFGGQSQGTSTTSDGSIASVLTQRTNINMRGLGAANTLVLVNGRRMSRSGNIRGSDGYDLTGIPVSAIDRVEVLTDGASAIYGSDAMGGVVNIILRKNYSGTEVTASYENTFDTDTAVTNVALTHGISRGPLSLTLNASYLKRNSFAAVDRYFVATDDWVKMGGTTSLAGAGNSFGGGGFAIGAGIVQAFSGNLPGRTSPYALIPDGATGAPRPAADYVSVVGDANGVPSYSGDRAKYVNLISPQFSRTIGFRGTYDLRPDVQFYFNGGYNETRTHIEGMPVNFRNSMGVVNAVTNAPIPADYPGNPFGVPLRLNKTFWELPTDLQGQKFTINSNQSFSTGLNGRFAGDWRYEVGLNWNRSLLKNENALDPVLENTAFNAAIASRRLVLFYDSRTQKPNDLDLLRSMLRPGNVGDRTDTTNWSASADGPLPWVKLPAGAIRLASGAERTTEEIKTYQATPENPLINQSLLGGFKRTLSSAYTETRFPIIGPMHQVPLLNRVDLTAALRYDDYSDAGDDFSPRYGAQVRPVKWLLFRATRNYSFRAPTVNALYRPITQSTNTNTTGFIDPVRNELVTGTILTNIGGNIDLKPEHAVSDNLGVVFELPLKLFKGLSLSVDRMKIDYNDQIASLGSLQEWATLAPERLIRDATTNRVTGVDTRSTNIARLELETFDYALNYSRTTPWGNLSARLAATEYKSRNAIRIPGAAPVPSVHLYPTRISWQSFWGKGPYGAGVSGFYQENSWTSAARTATQFASVIEWNVQASYDFGYRAMQQRLSGGGSASMSRWQSLRANPLADTKLSLVINNVFDREPPHRQGNAGFGVTDPRMRRYALTLRKKL
jgi:outer membrane receptor protein involved in Fe transport